MNRLYNALYYIIWPFFNLFHPVKGIGREHIPEGPAVICANHSHASDPFFVIFAFHRKYQMQVMSKAEVMRVPLLGWFLSKAGVFGVERGKTDMKAIKEAMRCLRGGNKLLMFPEGTRVREGQSVEAKTGAAMLAMRTGVPIVPVYLPPKHRWFRFTRVVIGEPLEPSFEGRRPCQEDYERVTAQLMERIASLKEQSN